MMSFLDFSLRGAGVGRSILATTATVVVCATGAFAQQVQTAKGIIKDTQGEAVIGASVRVKGTSTGASTDLDGRFSIAQVKIGAILEISSIGYIAQTVTFNGKELTIVLKEDNKQLDDVVVVGYGVQKKANLTGSVASLNAKAIEARPVSSISAALAGAMPGVTAIQSSGAPGAQVGNITIRGKNSINAASPLVIVDGVPGSMNAIDPTDIESVSVLKDAASSAIYGVQAANGVILITTKKGKKGDKTRINYSGTVSAVSPTARLQFLGAADYATLFNEATLNDNPNATKPFKDEDIELYRNGSKPDTHPNTDWYNEVFKPFAMETQHNLSVMGGSESTTYMASLAYLNQDGLSKEKNYKRYNGRVNLDSKITNWLSAGLNASAYRGLDRDEFSGFNSLMQGVNRIAPTVPVYDKEGNFFYSGVGNPVAMQGQSGTYLLSSQELNATAYLDYKPTFLKGLSIKGVFSLRHLYQDQRRFKRAYSYGKGNVHSISPREGYHNYYNRNWYTTQLLANYLANFGDHNINLLAGTEAVNHSYRFTETSRRGGGNNDLTESLNTLDEASQKNKDGGNDLARQSFFGRVQYDFLGKYLFEANLRADASSRFPKDSRWGIFPAFSAGWRISQESFMQNLKWLSSMKLRLGWGRTGNEELNELYPSIGTFQLNKVMFGDAIYTTAHEARYVNEQLRWATVTNYELGLDASFLNHKLGFELSLYKKRTDDMLLKLPISGVIGVKPPAQNAGSVENTGFDLNIYHNNQINKDWGYNIGLNVAYVRNRITDLKGTEGENPDNKKYWFLEGQPIGSFYGYVANGFFNTEEELKNYPKRTKGEKLGDIKYHDLNGDGVITGADRQVIGQNFPSWTAGLNLGVTYKDFDLSMLWQGAFDVDAYYEMEAAYSFFNGGKVLKRHLDRWTPEHHNASYPRLTRSSQINYQTSSFWLQDASYVRLKNITLGYSLPKSLLSRLGIERAKLFLTGENLLTFSGLEGLDPESPSETRGAFYSNVKKLSLGVKVSF